MANATSSTEAAKVEAQTTSGDVGRAARETSIYPWTLLCVLALISALSLVDRQLPFIAAEAIKRDLGLSDGQLGLVGGLAFSLFYTVLCLPAAALADRLSPKWVISLAVAIWSATTMLGGAATGFIQLCVARVGVAVGEAGCTAPSHALLADAFPARRRATALALYSLGGVLGLMGGFSLGGVLVDRIGWRGAFLVFGGFGLALSALAMVIVRPPSGTAATREPPMAAARTSARAAVRLLRSPTYRYLTLGASFHGLSVTAVMAWLSPFLSRVHHLTAGEAGSLVGLLSGLAGGGGVLLGGLAADRLSRRDLRWRLWTPAVAAATGLPLFLAAFASPQLGFALAFLAPATLMGLSTSGPVFATVQDLAPVRDRAVASALIVLIVGLIGGTAGPTAVGLFSDVLRPAMGAASLRSALAAIVLCGNSLGAMFFWLGAAHARRELSPIRNEGDA